MTLNDKVQVGDSTIGTTTTSTTASQWQTYNYSKAEQGWECPRCGHINAPWVRQCDCRGNYWYTTWTSDKSTTGDKPEWWRDYITCMQTDDVTKNPNVYQVSGSDYKEGNTYVNVSETQSNNKVEPNVTAWSCTPDIAINDFTTYKTDIPTTYTTIVNNIDNLQKQLDKLKETK